jgi:cyclophilin family peptidyl-prolyl cis-trans isomerase
MKIDGGDAALAAAYERGLADTAYGARASALEAIASYGGANAIALLKRGLSDPDWAVRWRAAELLRGLGEPEAAPAGPAPLRAAPEFFSSAALLHPSFSPHAFVETRRGTIEIQLNVVEAAVTSHTFVALARSGFFNGVRVHRVVPGFVVQAGDPRGDGQGGPGYTMRDELSELPYVRGTVGMALSWRDTAGSPWFVTLGPQPHLDARYTVFGRVVNGWDVLDQLAVGDVIERVRIWDGSEFR